MKFIIGLIITIILCSCNNKCNKDYNKYFNNKYDYYIIVDFSIHSGKNRFFLFDNNHNLLLESLCEHGNGMNSSIKHPVFSNKINSHCSSLGKYRVRKYNIMNFNNIPSFILDGLSNTNNNARKRKILIHPYYMIPDFEIYPEYLPMKFSNGCFVISPIKFLILKYYINNKKTVLYSIK